MFLTTWSRSCSRLIENTRSWSRMGKKSGAVFGAAWKKVRSRSRSRNKITRLLSRSPVIKDFVKPLAKK